METYIHAMILASQRCGTERHKRSGNPIDGLGEPTKTPPEQKHATCCAAGRHRQGSPCQPCREIFCRADSPKGPGAAASRTCIPWMSPCPCLIRSNPTHRAVPRPRCPPPRRPSAEPWTGGSSWGVSCDAFAFFVVSFSLCLPPRPHLLRYLAHYCRCHYRCRCRYRHHHLKSNGCHQLWLWCCSAVHRRYRQRVARQDLRRSTSRRCHPTPSLRSRLLRQCPPLLLLAAAVLAALRSMPPVPHAPFGAREDGDGGSDC